MPNFRRRRVGRTSAARASTNRLGFESLEARRLLATDIRFVTYNVLNFDSGSADRQDELEIVFAELDADVLVLQEVATATGANILLNALNANGQEYARSTFFDEPRTDQILYYRTSKVDLVGDSFIRTDLRSIGEYELSVDGSLFNVYNVHLKASQGCLLYTSDAADE